MSTDLTLQTQTITQQSKNLQVTNVSEAKAATELLSKANKLLDTLLKEEEKITKPAREVIKAEQARWAPMKKELKEIIESSRTKLSIYQTRSIVEAQAKADKIADRASRGTLSTETAVRKLGELDTPEEQIQAENGSLSFRAKQMLKIMDPQSIPREYCIPDEVRILEALKNGTKVPGCTIEVVQVPVNRRG